MKIYRMYRLAPRYSRFETPHPAQPSSFTVQWVKFFSDLAVEGNGYGIHMMDLWMNDRVRYTRELLDFLDE